MLSAERKRRSKTRQYVCLAPTSLEFVVKVSEEESRERGRGGRRGVRFRLVKSREAVILLS